MPIIAEEPRPLSRNGEPTRFFLKPGLVKSHSGELSAVPEDAGDQSPQKQESSFEQDYFPEEEKDHHLKPGHSPYHPKAKIIVSKTRKLPTFRSDKSGGIRSTTQPGSSHSASSFRYPGSVRKPNELKPNFTKASTAAENPEPTETSNQKK